MRWLEVDDLTSNIVQGLNGHLDGPLASRSQWEVAIICVVSNFQPLFGRPKQPLIPGHWHHFIVQVSHDFRLLQTGLENERTQL